MLKLIALTTLVLTLVAPTGRADSGEGNIAVNHGQSVSDCTHRANLQQINGQERKDFVDWCASRDEAAASENQQLDRYGECYARMTDRELSDAQRNQYLLNCAGRTAYHMPRS
jgi:hypothetical protein